MTRWRASADVPTRKFASVVKIVLREPLNALWAVAFSADYHGWSGTQQRLHCPPPPTQSGRSRHFASQSGICSKLTARKAAVPIVEIESCGMFRDHLVTKPSYFILSRSGSCRRCVRRDVATRPPPSAECADCPISRDGTERPGDWPIALNSSVALPVGPGRAQDGCHWQCIGQDPGRVLTRTLGEYFTGGDPLIFISD